METKRKPGRERTRKQFLVDDKGQRTAVLLPIEEYEEMLEALEQREDIRLLEAGKNLDGDAVPWEGVKARLRAAGKLS
jgi:hypothetical protein